MQIALTQPKAYQAAAVHIGNIQTIMKKEGKEKEWQAYRSGLRQANHRKKDYSISSMNWIELTEDVCKAQIGAHGAG